MELLKIHRRTLDYYIQRGYLKRVYGGGERAIGVSRDSYLKFIARRSGRCEEGPSDSLRSSSAHLA